MAVRDRGRAVLDAAPSVVDPPQAAPLALAPFALAPFAVAPLAVVPSDAALSEAGPSGLSCRRNVAVRLSRQACRLPLSCICCVRSDFIE